MLNIFRKTIKSSIYLLVFLLPLQTRWIIQAGTFNGAYFEYGTISLYLVDIILIFILLCYGLAIFIWKDKFNQKNVYLQRKDLATCWLLIAIIELFIFLSCFRAPDRLVAFYSYGRFLLGVGLFYTILSFLKVTKSRFGDNLLLSKSSIVYTFLVGTFFQSLLAIYQVITQSTFANKYLGLAEHLPATLGTSVVELADGTRWLRAYGGLDHPNILGGLMVFAIMLAVIELITLSSERMMSLRATVKQSRATTQRSSDCYSVDALRDNSKGEEKLQNSPFAKEEMSRWVEFAQNSLDEGDLGRLIVSQKIKFIFLIFSLVISTTTLFFTFSRSAWLALVAGLFTMLWFFVIKKQYRMQKAILQSILLVASIFFILFISFSSLVETRISGNTRLEQKSIAERSSMNSQAIEIINENWLWGVGIGNYTQYLQKKYPGKEVYEYQPVHNIILLVGAEIGVVALFVFIFLILYIFFNQVIYHVINHLNAFLIIPLLVLFLFDHWLWSLHFGVFLFWFILSLSLIGERPISITTK